MSSSPFTAVFYLAKGVYATYDGVKGNSRQCETLVRRVEAVDKSIQGSRSRILSSCARHTHAHDSPTASAALETRGKKEKRAFTRKECDSIDNLGIVLEDSEKLLQKFCGKNWMVTVVQWSGFKREFERIGHELNLYSQQLALDVSIEILCNSQQNGLDNGE